MDRYLAVQSFVHRTPFRDLCQSFSLFKLEGSPDVDFPFNMIDEATLALALVAVTGMDFAMGETYYH